jgi:hypothetical protein
MYHLSDTKLSRSDSHRRHLSVPTVALKCDRSEAWSKYHLSDASNFLDVSKTILFAKAQNRVSNNVSMGFSQNVLEFFRHANQRIRLPILLAKK